jgi:hypothetical protein
METGKMEARELLTQMSQIESNVAATLAAAVLGPGQSAATVVNFYREILTELRKGGGAATDSKGKQLSL